MSLASCGRPGSSSRCEGAFYFPPVSYRDDLRHPLWQRRRLEILQRDEFRCVECSEDSIELHVHHRYYLRGRKPWEYPDDALCTLCKECHELIGSVAARIAETIGMLPLKIQQVVLGYAAVALADERSGPAIRVVKAATAAELVGAGDALRLSEAELEKAARAGMVVRWSK